MFSELNGHSKHSFDADTEESSIKTPQTRYSVFDLDPCSA